MKKLFTSLRHANQTYGSFRQTAHSIMHRAGPAVLAAAVLYRAASGFLFVPLMQQIWSLTLRFAPMHYLNNSNASDIFTSPAIVGCIAAIAVLTAFWALYGFSILLHGLDRARRGETLRLLPLLGDSLRDIAHAWLPQNWLILIYSALLIPFTSFFLASDYITQLAVPEYILGVIRANARYHALYLAGALVLLALWVGGALVLPLFVLERKSLWQAARESFGFVRGRFFRVFLLLTRWNLSVAVGAALRLLAVAVPLYGIILAVGLESTQAMFAMSRAALVVELPFIFKDNETAWNFCPSLSFSRTVSSFWANAPSLRCCMPACRQTHPRKKMHCRAAASAPGSSWLRPLQAQRCSLLCCLPCISSCPQATSCAPCWAARHPSSRRTGATPLPRRRTPCPPFSWPSTRAANAPNWTCR